MKSILLSNCKFMFDNHISILLSFYRISLDWHAILNFLIPILKRWKYLHIIETLVFTGVFIISADFAGVAFCLAICIEKISLILTGVLFLLFPLFWLVSFGFRSESGVFSAFSKMKKVESSTVWIDDCIFSESK